MATHAAVSGEQLYYYVDFVVASKNYFRIWRFDEAAIQLLFY